MSGDDRDEYVAVALPEPLTPPDCDLRGMPFMPVDVIRLFDSDMFALSTGDEFKAAFTLWGKAFYQIPAGSLPDDDRILAHLSGAGDKWCDVRDMSQRGFIKCSDGRLYHPTVASYAMQALPMRKAYQEKKSAEAERKATEREDRSALFAALKAVGITAQFSIKTSELRALAAENNVTISHGQVTVTGHGQVTANKGKGKGKGNSKDTLAKAKGDAVVLDAPAPSVEQAAETHLWGSGKTFLISRGVPKGQAGSLIGKWKGAHGTASVIEALGVAEREPNLVDPVPFIEGIFRRRNGKTDDGFTPIRSPC